MDSNNSDISRRKFLKAAATAGATGTIAGCTDLKNQEPDETAYDDTIDDTTDDTTEDDDTTEEQGLQLNFTWTDIKQKELNHYEQQQRMPGVGDGTEGLKHIDRSFLQNANLLNYDEFQDALVGITNHLVHDTLGEKISSDSSTLLSGASGAINIAIQEELENNETYQEEDLQIKMMPLTNDGHGYTQVASTHHPLTTVDSNEPIAGPTEEAPLDERNTRDPISRFVDKNFKDVDEFDRPTYHGLPGRIYSKGTDSSAHTGFKSSIIDSYYEEAIFTEEQEGRELWLGPVRQAVGTLRALWDEDYFEKEYIAISSPPSELPTIEEHENFDSYTETLIKDHIEKYAETHKMREAVLEP